MEQFYRIIFLYFLLISGTAFGAKSSTSYFDIEKAVEKKITKIGVNNLLLPTATITTSSASVCIGGTSPVITFTGKDGTAPYTFVYKINNGSDISIISQGTDNTATVNVPTGVAGTFTYTLVSVSDSSGTQSQTGAVTVTVKPLPVIDFTFVDSQCSGTAIQFTSSVTGTGPYTYAWNFGDSSTSILQNPSHAFSSLGCGTETFTVILTVTDANGCSVTTVHDVIIKQKPDIDFKDNNSSFSPFSNCQNASASNPSYSISVDNNSASSCITSYAINWGDGNSESNISFPILHTYSQLGAFNMIITALGTNGCSNSKMYVVKNVTNPSGGIVSPGNTTNLCAPTVNIQFAISAWWNNSIGTVYDINYGDNSPIVHLTQNELESSTYYNSANPSASSNYPIPHTYTTTSCPSVEIIAAITITNACSTTKGSVSNITIFIKPEANFTAPASACLNTNVLFTNTTISGFNQDCSQGSIYRWNFGDGTPIITTPLQSPQNINHSYTTPGNYTVTLTAEGSCGISVPVTRTICIEAPLVPVFTLDSNVGCTPVAVTVTNTTNGAGACNPLTYLWEVTYVAANCGSAPAVWSYTNNTNQNSANPSFSFVTPGTYTVKLTTTNSCGSFNTTQTITVKQPPTVVINPIADYCSPATINPTALVDGCVPASSALTYAWSFPGGTPATFTNATPEAISYTIPGIYTVSLTVTNECGSTTATSNSFTINPTPTVDDITSQVKCKGQQSDAIVFSGTVANTVYNWTNTDISIGLAASGTGNINPFLLTNVGTTILTATITVTPSLNGCTGTPKNFIITVHPNPTVNAISNTTVCNNATQSGIVFGSSVAGTLFSWSNDTTTIGLASSGTGDIPSFTAINTGTLPIVATITVTPSNALGCNGIPKTFTITVNPTPSLSTLSNNEYCNGVITTAITFSSPVTGTTYAWTNSNTSIGLGASGTGTIPSFNPTNTGTSPITATITVTPTANGCSGPLQTFTITVNPSPIVTFLPDNQTICSGDNTTLVTLNSTTSGATFNWTAVVPTGITGVATSGTNTIPVQTLVNSTNTDIAVTYKATATLSGAVPCTGAESIYTITVKTKPFVSGNMAATICSGLSFTVTPLNGSGNIIPIGTTYTWGVPIVTGGLTGGVTGLNLTTINGTLTNSTNVVQTATYTVTPVANGCSGLPFDVVVSVNPKPTVNTVSNISLCNGQSTTQIDFTGDVSGTVYNWTSNDTTIGIGASGLNTIPSFTAVNAGTVPVTVTITVTPSANGCSGLSTTFTITVNPTPTVNPIANSVKCNNQTSGTITFTGNVAGTIYDWINDTPSIGLAASGNGNIASFTTVNTGTTPIIATITVTPTVNGCVGTPQTFTITVNPTPTVDQPANQEVCNGMQTVGITFSGTINNTDYSWTNNTTSIGLGASGTGDISAFSAVNNGTSPIIATITITPNLNGCSGASKTVTITVKPSPIVAFSQGNQTICSGSQSAVVNLSSTTSGATFVWTAVQPVGITGVITSGTNQIPAQTLINITNLPIVITYLATAESSSGVSCQGSVYPYTITVNPVPLITTPQQTTICNGTSFNITPQDGNGNIIPANTLYTWSNPIISPIGAITGGSAQNVGQNSISQTLSNITDQTATATYTVTPKSGTCAGSTFEVVVTVNPSPKVQFSGANQTTCSGSDTLPITLSSVTTGNVTFNWVATVPSGISGAVLSGTDSIPVQNLVNTTTSPLTVTYAATATLNNGVICKGAPFNYTITVNPSIITSSILSNYNGFNISTVGANDGSIDVTVSGGSGVYTYLWSGPSGFSAATQDISNVPAGAYTLTINDGICGLVVLNFTLTEPLPFLIQEDLASHVNVLCNGASTGAINVEVVQQSVGPYDYVLTLQGGAVVGSIMNLVATNYLFSGLPAGTYDATVTDANGSVKTITGIIITQSTGITASITAQANVSCSGSNTGSATVTASGGEGTLTYSWDTSPIQTLATATALAAGTYTVTITDGNSCSITKQVTIKEPNGIVTSIGSQTNVGCFGESSGSATVIASGGTGTLTYSWDTTPVQTAATATGLPAGTYNVTITDANSCAKVQLVTITQPSAALSSSITSSTNVSCFGGNNGSATATASGGMVPYSYLWDTTPVQTLATATGLIAGIYNVTVKDANGCSASIAVTINEPTGINASITAQTDVSCSGSNTGSATVSASGGTGTLSYSWNTSPIQTLATATALAAGTYIVTISDGNSCSTTKKVTITEPNGIVTSIGSQTNVGCFGESSGSATVIASGGIGTLTYSWDTIPVQATATATGLSAGAYNVTITDANSCTKVQLVTITQPADIVIITDLEKDVTCFGNANGEIAIAVTGGTGVYNYIWKKDGAPFSTSEDISNLASGDYSVTVSDANNCGPKTASFTITEPPVLDLKLVSQTNILCYGAATGDIKVNVIGGTPIQVSPGVFDYNFSWTGPNGYTNTSQNLTTILAGTYHLTVTDNSGCSQNLAVTLTQPTEIIVTAKTTPIICYGDNDASITLTISGGITPYQILWSNLGSGTFQDNLSAGNYQITVTDANGCPKTIDINIQEPSIFTINPVVVNVTCFGAHDGSINLNIVGGIAPVTLVWSDSAVVGNVRNNLGPGTYTVTISDGKPCTITRTFVILEPQALVLTANVTHAFNCDDANSGAINLLVAGGTPPFTYAWSNGATTGDLFAIPAGNYLVTVTDARGCTKTAQYSINRQLPIVIGVAANTDVNCETKDVKQTFLAQVSGGAPPYQLNWSSGTVSGANNEMMVTNQNGTVILGVTDNLGCTANYSFNVDELPKLGSPSFTTSSYAYTTFGVFSITDPIQFTNTATGDYISIVWNFGDGSVSNEVNPIHSFVKEGSYVVTQTVTYPFGCIYTHIITLAISKGYELIIPNGFTPNGDGINDTFRPIFKGLKSLQLDVYDTWGELIYSEEGETLHGWDGKIKEKESENGNYFYKVTTITFYGTIINEHGPFVLIK